MRVHAVSIVVFVVIVSDRSLLWVYREITLESPIDTPQIGSVSSKAGLQPSYLCSYFDSMWFAFEPAVWDTPAMKRLFCLVLICGVWGCQGERAGGVADGTVEPIRATSSLDFLDGLEGRPRGDPGGSAPGDTAGEDRGV